MQNNRIRKKPLRRQGLFFLIAFFKRIGKLQNSL